MSKISPSLDVMVWHKGHALRYHYACRAKVRMCQILSLDLLRAGSSHENVVLGGKS